MKLDIREHADQPICNHATVYLDGQKIPQCIAADEDAGTAVAYALGANGKAILDPANRFEPKIEHLRGQVRIELTPRGQEILAMRTMAESAAPL